MHNTNLAAIYHMPWLEYRHALPDGRICLRVRVAHGDFDTATVRHCCNYDGENPFLKAESAEMSVAYHDGMFDYYEVLLRLKDPRVKYLFILKRDDLTVKYDAAGCHIGPDAPETTDNAFTFAYAWKPEPMPDWARGCVGYQIFPDRFRRAGEAEEGLAAWNSTHYESDYRFGGNLRGIREAVPYLHELGVNIVYMTPIFFSDTAHRYNTFDYYRIDPLLGDETDLKALCDELHRHKMHLVLDGVFNHSGTGFAPFADVMEKREKSRYYDWFLFDNTCACGYQTFAHEAYMPKLNLRNPDCADFFLRVGRYWMEKCGIDGWRLDVSPEVWPDFWRKYHAMMREVNPLSIMIAECWDDSREWLTLGDMFDSNMNYVLSRAIWRRIAAQEGSVAEFDENVNFSYMLYPKLTQDVLWNFLGSHDTPRVRTRAGGSEALLRAASFFQLTQPGVPFVYYGDELGMEGKGDPDCRRPMRWDNVEDNPVLEHYKRLIHLRNASPALRYGVFRSLDAQENGLFAFLRIDDAQCAFIALNVSAQSVKGYVSLPAALAEAETVIDALTGESLPVAGGRLPLSLGVGEGVIVLYAGKGDQQI